MSKTTDWVIEIQEQAANTGYMEYDDEWGITVDEFNEACDAMETSLDTFLEKYDANPLNYIDPDEYRDNLEDR